MDTTSLPGRLLRFGRFEVDLQSRELRKGGIRLRIQDQPFQLLAMLLQRPGEVLTREELRARLWPQGTFVDFERGLNAAVKRLRAVLGDAADNPRFVETLHRRGYRFIAPVDGDITGAGAAADPSPRPHRPAPGGPAPEFPAGRPRLAVLPFRHLGDAARDYFCDGMTGELIAQLGRLCARRLGVIARTSAISARTDGRSIREIADLLRADYVLDGSVRRVADRVRITAELIETREETHLWAGTYERALADSFSVQSEVALDIARSLMGELLPAQRPAGSADSRHPGAYQAYLTGLYQWNQPSDAAIGDVVSHFERATELDPGFAPAHAALALALVGLAGYYYRVPREALEAARTAATRALELDPRDAMAHVAMACVHQFVDRDLPGAEAAFLAAIASNPSNEAAHRRYGLLLACRGQIADGAAAVQRGWELDPMCLVATTTVAYVSYLARDHAAALAWCRRTLVIDAGYAPARRLLAAALLQLGRREEAVAELRAVAGDGQDPVARAWLAHALIAGGDRAAGMAAIACAPAGAPAIPAYHRALVHAAAGEAEAAFRALDQASDEADPALAAVAMEPRFDPLRTDRRYAGLVETLGLPVEAL